MRGAWLCLVMLVGLPGAALAGGIEYPDNGARAAGRAGAFVARADDLSAFVHNPAGLAQLHGTHLMVDVSLSSLDYCFDRSGNYPGTPRSYSFAGQPYPKVCRLEQGMFPIPLFYLASDFGLKRWTFVFGGNGPHAVGTRRFPRAVTVRDPQGRPIRAPGPTRYDLLFGDGTIIYFGVGVAFHAASWLDLGFTVEAAYVAVLLSTTVNASGGTDPDSDVAFGVDVEGWAATGKLGLLVHPYRGLHLGLSVRLPFSPRVKGSATVRFPAGVPNVLVFEPEGRQIIVDSRQPLIVRSGIRYAWMMRGGHRELADLELDVVYERWRTFTSTDTQIRASLFGDRLSTVFTPHFWQDTVELRLGSSFTVPRRLGPGWLTVRLGIHYGSDASPLEYTRLDYAAWARIGAFVGLGYELWGVRLDLAFSYIVGGRGKAGQPWTFRPHRTVEGSCVASLGFGGGAGGLQRCDPANPPADAIGNGRYRTARIGLHIGLSLHFDAMVRAAKGKKRR